MIKETIKQMPIYTCYNFKGGSGKTTSNVELAISLAMKGYKVALVDLDPQGNASFNLGDELTEKDFRAYTEGKHSLFDIRQEVKPNLDLYPTNPTRKLDELADSVFLNNPFFFERKFYRDIKELNYNYVIIDMSPKLDRINRMILGIANEIIFTLNPEICGMQGIFTLENELETIKSDLSMHGNIEYNKIVLCGFNKTMKVHNDILKDLEDNFNYQIFTVPQKAVLKTLRAEKKTAIDSNKADDVADIYLKIANAIG